MKVHDHVFKCLVITAHCQDATHNGGELTNNERVLTSLVAGAFAGAIAKTTIAPLDRTKIYFQTSTTARYNAGTVLKYLSLTYSNTGLLSLWRGNSATMARIIPYAAIQFTAHEQWKRLLKADTSELARFAAGSLAGVTAQSATYPLDLTRARLAISSKSKYKTLTSVFIKTVKVEGVGGLYKGYVVTMIGVIPYAGCSFYCYETLKRVWKESGFVMTGYENIAFGAIAGVLGQSASYPFDIVRRRLQTSYSTKRVNLFAHLVHIARTEGIVGGLYKGLSMNWIKGPVAAGISFSAYDWTREFLRKRIITTRNS